MALQEGLLASVYVPLDEDAAAAVVDLALLEYDVGVVQGREGED